MVYRVESEGGGITTVEVRKSSRCLLDSRDGGGPGSTVVGNGLSSVTGGVTEG